MAYKKTQEINHDQYDDYALNRLRQSHTDEQILCMLNMFDKIKLRLTDNYRVHADLNLRININLIGAFSPYRMVIFKVDGDNLIYRRFDAGCAIDQDDQVCNINRVVDELDKVLPTVDQYNKMMRGLFSVMRQ